MFCPNVLFGSAAMEMFTLNARHSSHVRGTWSSVDEPAGTAMQSIAAAMQGAATAGLQTTRIIEPAPGNGLPAPGPGPAGGVAGGAGRGRTKPGAGIDPEP